MRIRFENLELDEDRRELRRDGEPLAVEPRVFDLIAYLVRHRDRTVSKDELLERLWPDRDVQEGALAVCVHRARRFVEEGGSRVIQTEARRGYRFVASVELLREGGGGPQGRELLVGRSAELAELHRAVEEVLPSRLRTVEVVGEPGIGKTALLEELGTYGRLHKLEVWRVAPSPSAVAYSLWVQLISAYVARYDVRSIRRAMGQHLDHLACIVPALERWCLPGAAKLSTKPRDELLNAIALSVQAATARRPGLLLFDDVDGSDAESMAAMGRVLRACGHVPVLIAVAYRRESAVPGDVLRQMRALDGHRRLVLRGLDHAALRAMLEQMAGAPVAHGVVSEVLHASAGKPRLVEEWWRRELARRAGAGTSSDRHPHGPAQSDPALVRERLP
ncbi:MAG: winged helix-turn-helix domain-containing protein [Candidatus Binatia bacterium]